MSAGREEHADARRTGDFPTSWGYPEGRRFSPERARWVRRMVLEHGDVNPHRQLAARSAALLSLLRRAELMRRRSGPGGNG